MSKIQSNHYYIYAWYYKNTGEILPIVLDKDNHYIDAIRYALNPYIQKKVSILSVLD